MTRTIEMGVHGVKYRKYTYKHGNKYLMIAGNFNQSNDWGFYVSPNMDLECNEHYRSFLTFKQAKYLLKLYITGVTC